MKTRERQGAKQGGYLVCFKELIRPGNTVGLKEAKSGAKRLMLRFQVLDKKTGEPVKGAADIPYSFEWDLDNEYARSALGAIGVPATRVKAAMKKANGVIERVLIWLEKEAKSKGQKLYTYVREDGGFATGLKPPENADGYYAQYVGIISRDEETKLPHWYEKKSEKRPGKKPGSFYDSLGGCFFKADFRVLTGPYMDAHIRNEFFYAIVKDEDDEWIVDADSGPGASFKKLLTLHKIKTDSIDPDRDFADAVNGCPELDKRLLKRAPMTPLIIVIKEDGWVKEFKAPPAGTVIEGAPQTGVDVGDKDGGEYAADPELVAKLFAMIDRRVKKSAKKAAFLEDGKLSASGRAWLDEAQLPHSFEKLTDHQVTVYMKRLKEKFPLQ